MGEKERGERGTHAVRFDSPPSSPPSPLPPPPPPLLPSPRERTLDLHVRKLQRPEVPFASSRINKRGNQQGRYLYSNGSK